MPRSNADSWIAFRFEGKEEPLFADRIQRFLTSVESYFGWLSQMAFDISSENSFPHSSGIASSASSMSALAMCLCEIDAQLREVAFDEKQLQKASYIARLGSGSASRSIYPKLASWGVHPTIDGSSDLFASPYDGVNPVFESIHDDVLIVSSDKKSVSSSAGHALMDTNPFASTRYQQASHNMTRLLEAMKSDDLTTWGEIVEDEAMTLHALMMCSHPSYVLMKPSTLTVIEKIRGWRAETGLPLYFTLDAGPNVHILYPDEITDEANDFIENQLLSFAEGGLVIRDQVGLGPTRL